MLALVDRSLSGDGEGPSAVPAVYRGTEGRPGPVLFTLDVDGERFAIRRAGEGGTACDWLSGGICQPERGTIAGVLLSGGFLFGVVLGWVDP